MRRGFWFLAGATTGVYALTRARRAAEVFTPEGLGDRLAAASVGLRLFQQELKVHTAAREAGLRERLRSGPTAVGAGTAGELPAPVATSASRAGGST
jgi:hypothetical protein